jgi:hypothetical protein
MVVSVLIVLASAASITGAGAAAGLVAGAAALITGASVAGMAGAGVDLVLGLVTLGILSVMGMVDSTDSIIALIMEVTEEE